MNAMNEPDHIDSGGNYVLGHSEEEPEGPGAPAPGPSRSCGRVGRHDRRLLGMGLEDRG